MKYGSAELESSYKDCFNLLKPHFTLEQAHICFKLRFPNCAYKKPALSTINYKSPQPVHPNCTLSSPSHTLKARDNCGIKLFENAFSTRCICAESDPTNVCSRARVIWVAMTDYNRSLWTLGSYLSLPLCKNRTNITISLQAFSTEHCHRNKALYKHWKWMVLISLRVYFP